MIITEFISLKQRTGKQTVFDVGKIKNPIKTEETFREFLAMNRDEQMNVKDNGGFVAGISSDGTRNADAIVARTMVTLDLDDADATTLETIKATAFCKLWVHSTRKHTDDNPRYRLILPLAHPIGGDEYEALARFVARDLNVLEYCDLASFRLAQLMLWPTVSSDMQNAYVFFESSDEDFLDPVMYLSKYDYQNIGTWPRKSSESRSLLHEITRGDDPREKPGVVGAFCKAFSVSEAVDKFLGKVYERSRTAPDRYDLIGSNSVGGLVIYNDIFAFSFHSNKDPAAGNRLNAFDLVKTHLFGELDLEAAPNTPFVRMPSNLAMIKFALKIPKVREHLGLENNTETVQRSYDYTTDGRLKPTPNNVALVLEEKELLDGICKNLFTNEIEVVADLPWRKGGGVFSDNDYSSLVVHLSSKYGLNASSFTVMSAVKAVAEQRSFHPVRSWIESLPDWDGEPRLARYLVDFLGAPDDSYVRFISQVILVAAIAHVFEPGIKFDLVPVLVGPQGCGKSTIFAKLFGVWFNDTLTLADMRDKSALEKLSGAWCLEIAELAGMAKADLEVVKAFITRQIDKCRFAYARAVTTLPRQCIIIGTSNQEDGFLRDATGNRRFCCVRVTGVCDRHPWELSDDEVSQIWSEALAVYRSGKFSLYLKDEIAEIAKANEREFIQADDRKGLVEKYLSIRIPQNWKKLPEVTRQRYVREGVAIEGEENPTIGVRRADFEEPLELRSMVSNAEIFCECFGKDFADFSRSDANDIALIMKSIEGWQGDKVFANTPYGKQRCYAREG